MTPDERRVQTALSVLQREEREALKQQTPYPMFCRTPEKCAGKGNCQAEICCAD